MSIHAIIFLKTNKIECGVINLSFLFYEDDLNRILTDLPSENATIDYKQIPYQLSYSGAVFIKDVVAMLNSEEGYGYDKYIIIGVEDIDHNLIGLKTEMSDDADYQNLVDKMYPRPEVQTGVFKFDGLQFGYIRISKDNLERVYEVNKSYISKNEISKKKDCVCKGLAFIRRGSKNYVMTQADRRRIENTRTESDQYTLREYAKIFAKEANIKVFSPLMIAFLLGEWDEEFPGDRALIEELAGDTYENWIINLYKLKADGDTNIAYTQGKWKIKNRETIILSIGANILNLHVDAFEKCATKILSETNPRFSMSVDQRHLASLSDEKRKYSELIRRGVAETLAILSSNKEVMQNCLLGKVDSSIYNVIHNVFNKKDWKLWESLGRNHLYLAQASPTAYFRVFEEASSSDNNVIEQLVHEKDGILAPSHCGAGVINALQVLAWNKDCFGRACISLAQIVRYDSKRVKDLVVVLLPWHPQTEAISESRVAVVRAITREDKNNAWIILKELLPRQTTTGMEIEKPKYLKGNYEAPVITVKAFWEESNKYLDIAIEAIRGNAENMAALVDLLDDVDIDMMKKILALFSCNEIKEELSKYMIWDKLLDLISRHKKFESAQWALPDEHLHNIETVADLMQPQDKYLRAKRYFKEKQYDLSCERDIEKAEQTLCARQKELVKDIFQDDGLLGVLLLSKLSDKPELVGRMFSLVCENDDFEDAIITVFVESIDIKELGLSKGFIIERFAHKGYKWIKNILKPEESTKKKIELLLLLPFEKETWDLVTAWLGKEQIEYWENASVWRSGNDTPRFVIEWLITAKRTAAAIYLIANAVSKRGTYDIELSCTVLEEHVKNQTHSDSMTGYYVSKIISWLQIYCLDKERLTLIEWKYLQVLEETKPKTLFSRLANDPDYFMSFLCILYNRKDKKEEQKITDENIISQTWHLFDAWDYMPGMQEDGTFDVESMKKWIEVVKEKSLAEDRYDVAMHTIGKISFYAPPNSDGFFIHESVAEMLDDRDAENQRRGYDIQVYNSRGAHYVDSTGLEEEKIALEWEERAVEAEKRSYIRFACLLRSIANSFRRDGERNIAEHNVELLVGDTE